MTNAITLFRSCGLSTAAMVVLVSGAVAQGVPLIPTRNVLFVGNSYTYNAVGFDNTGQGNFTTDDGTYSDRFFADSYRSPFEALVLAAEGSFGSSQNIAVGGRTLAQHAGAESLDRPTILYRNNYEVLQNTAWDVIVIQEYSTLAGHTVSGVGSSYPYDQGTFDSFYLNGLEPITDKIKQYAPNAEVLLFNTWARSPDGYPTDGWDNYNQMRDRTDEAYANARDYLITPTNENAVFNPGTGTFLQGQGFASDKVNIAKVSQAFDFVSNDPNYNEALYGDVYDLLYEDDSSHQDQAGEFLTAAVLFEMIYGKSVLSMIQSGALQQQHLNGLNGGNANFSSTLTYNLDLQLATYLAGVSQTITGVPEPATLALTAAGLLVAGWRRRKA